MACVIAVVHFTNGHVQWLCCCRVVQGIAGCTWVYTLGFVWLGSRGVRV